MKYILPTLVLLFFITAHAVCQDSTPAAPDGPYAYPASTEVIMETDAGCAGPAAPTVGCGGAVYERTYYRSSLRILPRNRVGCSGEYLLPRRPVRLERRALRQDRRSARRAHRRSLLFTGCG